MSSTSLSMPSTIQTCSRCKYINNTDKSYGVIAHNRNNVRCPNQSWNIDYCIFITSSQHIIRRSTHNTGLVPYSIAKQNRNKFENFSQEQQNLLNDKANNILTHSNVTPSQISHNVTSTRQVEEYDIENKELGTGFATRNVVKFISDLNKKISQLKQKSLEDKSTIERCVQEIYSLNNMLDRYEDSIFERDNTIKELQSQVKPREDNKGQCIVNIMEAIDLQKSFIGDGAYKILMDLLAKEYNN